MLRIGLTGGIACGKSTVARMFERRGARIAFADELAKQMLRPGNAAYDEVVRVFGRDILQPSGEIDRAALAAKAFATPPRIEELNRILHPAVVARQNAWMAEIGRADPHVVAIVEAALIFEAGAAPDFDKIVVVTCRPEQKPERFAARHAMPIDVARGEVERRSRSQIADAEKASRADFVIDNSGSEAGTEQQVERIWRQLQALA
jgi:dephospho-CoA kinase